MSFVAKYSSTNVLLWARAFGGGGTDATFSNAIKLDGSGNVYVAGPFTGVATLGGTILTSAGGYDVFVAKLSSTASQRAS